MRDAKLQALGEHVARREDLELGAAHPSEEARRHLAEYVAQRSNRATSRGSPQGDGAVAFYRRAWLRLSLAAVLVLGIFAAKEAVFWRPPLTFSVGPSAQVGILRAWESAAQDNHLAIRFSDGTVVDLEPNARARVVAVGRSGAEVVIESGRVHVDVVPARQHVPGESPWRFSTGPFSIEVKGTRFDVDWDPRADQFALNLFDGSVIVEGCGRDAGHVILAGQGVRASCGRKEWTVESLAAAALAAPAREAASRPPVAEAAKAIEAPAAPLPSDPVVAGSERGPARNRASTRPASSDSRERSWQELARAGYFARAFERSLSAGFEAECERVSADDLTLLGDAARLSGDAERARMAYTALRRRFAGEVSAARAAFALGRLSVDADPEAAAGWLDVYLREQPRGPLVPAALDRMFELALTAAAPGRLREVATLYLERHPSGPHASDARRVLQPAASEL